MSSLTASAFLVILITIFFPPLGIFLLSGCSVDLCINILLTILGYIPGHIHAFYLEYIYYKQREDAAYGIRSREYGGAYSQPEYGTLPPPA